MSDTVHSAKAGTDASSVMEAARGGEPDRYLAALLAPPAKREALLALAAFSAELSRIPLRAVREPAMGEIRLQWWRDALAMPSALRTGHPVADAVRAAALGYRLPAGLVEAPIDGRSLLLRAGGDLLSAQQQSDLLWETEGALFALGARVVGVPQGADLDAGCIASGTAYGLVRLLLGLPRGRAQGHVWLTAAQLETAGLAAEDVLSGVADARIERLLADCSAQIRRSLAAAKQFAAGLPRPARVAFLPLALVEPYLRALERLGRGLLHEEARPAPLTRVCRIAAAHLLGP